MFTVQIKHMDTIKTVGADRQYSHCDPCVFLSGHLCGFKGALCSFWRRNINTDFYYFFYIQH